MALRESDAVAHTVGGRVEHIVTLTVLDVEMHVVLC